MDRYDIPIIEIRNRLARKAHVFIAKRILDIVIALTLLFCLSPLLVTAAVLVRVSSPGAVFYRQVRVGRNGAQFKMHKFRSMRIGQAAPLPLQPLAKGDVVKRRDDPRVTPVGRWLRRYSIDELPQLFDVLTGSMSLVGPRPLPPHMAAPYPQFMTARNLVRPGMTGLFQLRDRDKGQNASFMIDADIEYLMYFGLMMDLKILLSTPAAVISARGAY